MKTEDFDFLKTKCTIKMRALLVNKTGIKCRKRHADEKSVGFLLRCRMEIRSKASDSLAKSFYSTIMTDLGKLEMHSLVQQPTAIRLSSPKQVFRTPRPQYVTCTKHQCQVPRWKSTRTLFVSILITDFVFMQSLWIIFSFGSVIRFIYKHFKNIYNCLSYFYHNFIIFLLCFYHKTLNDL